MKKILLTISLILCILILPASLTSCKKFDPLSDLDSFTICNVDISKYKIIYASPNPEEVKWENYYFGVDYKFDEITANELKAQINGIFGEELDVVCDIETEPSEYEILIGKTNREVSKELNLDSLMPNERICQVMSNKLILCGGDYSSTYHCIDLLIEEFQKQANKGSKIISLDTSFKSQAICSIQNIAVIGDDTFNKSTISDTDILNVPSVMQRLLWKNYNIQSYLADDSTVRSDLDQGEQYISTDIYKHLIENSTDLDAVIINLGTYDLKYCEGDWDKTDDAMFLSCYKSIVEELHSINKELMFYICTTVGSGNNQKIINAQKSIYKALVDLDYDVTLIELDTLMDKYISYESFTDDLYPKEYASAIIAKRIATEFSQKGDQ